MTKKYKEIITDDFVKDKIGSIQNWKGLYTCDYIIIYSSNKNNYTGYDCGINLMHCFWTINRILYNYYKYNEDHKKASIYQINPFKKIADLYV